MCSLDFTSNFIFSPLALYSLQTDLKAQATAIKTAIDAAFSTAIAGYA